jgi:hypothetical protein
MTVAAKWLGPCHADQKPGDMIMPGDITMNLRDLGNGISVQSSASVNIGASPRPPLLVLPRFGTLGPT